MQTVNDPFFANDYFLAFKFDYSAVASIFVGASMMLALL